jgi:HlyD family secretion protein
MSASAEIQTRREINILSVSLNAVTTRDKKDGKPTSAATKDNKPEDKENKETDGKTVVNEDLEEVMFVYDTKTTTVKKVKVKTGVQDLNFIQIIIGLKAGEQVVTGPYNLVSKTLKEGDKIMKTDKDKLFEEKKKDE